MFTIRRVSGVHSDRVNIKDLRAALPGCRIHPARSVRPIHPPRAARHPHSVYSVPTTRCRRTILGNLRRGNHKRRSRVLHCRPRWLNTPRTTRDTPRTTRDRRGGGSGSGGGRGGGRRRRERVSAPGCADRGSGVSVRPTIGRPPCTPTESTAARKNVPQTCRGRPSFCSFRTISWRSPSQPWCPNCSRCFCLLCVPRRVVHPRCFCCLGCPRCLCCLCAACRRFFAPLRLCGVLTGLFA